jgi:aspartyl-tRNA(Asn)/glutamyl-tRNA(Gln) amidotransferase subunit C
MKATVSLDEVRHIAKLSRLTLTEAELGRMQQDLTGILGYIEKLDELDTKNVEPTSHAVELPTKLREDTVRKGLPVERALKNAPERLGDGFGVPKIIE